jgi:hypothetical protein
VRHLALAALLAAACGPTPAAAPGQLLSLAFHKGDVYSYSFSLTAQEMLDGFPVTLNETAHLTYTVTLVDAAGKADITVEPSSVVVTKTEDHVTSPISTSPNSTIDLQVASDGRVLSENVNLGPAVGPINWGVLPGGAVKPGDTWAKNYEMTLVGSVGTNRFTTTSKYLRDESLQGSNAAVVETTITLTSDLSSGPSTTSDTRVTSKGTTTAIVTTWIDRDAHRILKSHVTATFDQSGTYDSPPLAPTVVSLSGDETADLLPA